MLFFDNLHDDNPEHTAEYANWNLHSGTDGYTNTDRNSKLLFSYLHMRDRGSDD